MDSNGQTALHWAALMVSNNACLRMYAVRVISVPMLKVFIMYVLLILSYRTVTRASKY